MADKLTVPGHAWQSTCFSSGGRYGNCECGKQLYVTYVQHQKHLAVLIANAPDSLKSVATRLAAVEAQVQKLTAGPEPAGTLPSVICAGCGFVIEDVGFVSIGGNIVPYVPAKNYHLGCVPRVPAAPARREVTADQLLEWVKADRLVPDDPYKRLASHINAFFGGD